MQDRYLGRIVPGMDICDRNGDKFGTVAHVYRYDSAALDMAHGSSRVAQHEVVEVKTGFLGLGKRLYIPTGFIQDVTPGSVFMSKVADEIMHNDQLWYKPSYLDELH
jgi:hypothetical protein